MIGIIIAQSLATLHPFPNGNGRYARLMADLLLENVFGEKRLSWGTVTDLSKTSDIRCKYIRALQAADELDYELLIAFAQS
jgi:fido (protein-threonine AMPylation protein)